MGEWHPRWYRPRGPRPPPHTRWCCCSMEGHPQHELPYWARYSHFFWYRGSESGSAWVGMGPLVFGGASDAVGVCAAGEDAGGSSESTCIRWVCGLGGEGEWCVSVWGCFLGLGVSCGCHMCILCTECAHALIHAPHDTYIVCTFNSLSLTHTHTITHTLTHSHTHTLRGFAVTSITCTCPNTDGTQPQSRKCCG